MQLRKGSSGRKGRAAAKRSSSRPSPELPATTQLRRKRSSEFRDATEHASQEQETSLVMDHRAVGAVVVEEMDRPETLGGENLNLAWIRR
jgi:hypothetical protein